MSQSPFDDLKLLLRDLNNAAALRSNALLSDFSELSHEELRTMVLRAVETLEPGHCTSPGEERRKRHHTIVLRCDVYGESTKVVASDLGLSRRQFFRERREALHAFGAAFARLAPPRRAATTIVTDLHAARESFIQKLRACGRHELVWKEASALARDLDGQEGAIEAWTIAAEAARYDGSVMNAANAIEQAKRTRASIAALRRPRAASIRIAIAELSIDWIFGRYDTASERFKRILDEGGDERALHGGDATLFGILLAYGTAIESERGRWEQAQTLLRRAECLADRMEQRYTAPALRRLSGRIALRAQHDVRRAIVELRDALASFRHFENLAGEASAAVDLGIALAEGGAPDAERHIDYGLAIGRSMMGRDEFAMITLGSLPTTLQVRGLDGATRVLEELRSAAPLADRARNVSELAEAEIFLFGGRYHPAIERAEALAQTFDRSGSYAAASEATVIAAEGYAGIGQSMRARRLLQSEWERIHTFGDWHARRRATSLGTLLAPELLVV